MIRKALLGVAGMLATVVLAGSAQAAATTTYYLEGNGSDFYSATLQVSDGAVTGAHIMLTPQQCSAGSPQELDVGSFDPATITDGDFTVTASPETGTGTITITGSVSSNGTMTGTVSLSDYAVGADSGCTGTYSFIGLTTVGPVPTTDGLPGLTAASGKRDYVTYEDPQDGLSFDYRSGVISDMTVEDGAIRCGQSVDSVYLTAAEYGQPSIQTHDGSFTFQSEVLDEYNDVLDLTVTGKLGKSKATGTMKVTQVTGFAPYIFSTQGACSASTTWTATPPPVPTVSVKFDVALIRVPFHHRHYRYYLIATHLKGTDGANAVRITVGGYTVTSKLGDRSVWITRPIELNRSYVVKSVALERKGKRMLKSANQVAQHFTVPPHSEIRWHGTGRLPGGHPPK